MDEHNNTYETVVDNMLTDEEENYDNDNDNDNDNVSTKCIVCHENGTVMKLTHTCGEWYIHDECLTTWFNIHPNECFICRKKYINTNAKLVSNIGADLSYLLVGNSTITTRNIRRIDKLQILFYCIPLLCCVVIVNVICVLISIAYNFLFIARPLNRTYI